MLLFKDNHDELCPKTEFNRLINVQKATLDNLREAVVVFSADGRLRLHNELRSPSCGSLHQDQASPTAPTSTPWSTSCRASITTATPGRTSRTA